MKLRIFADSLRFRLTQKEVGLVGQGQGLESVTRILPDSILRCVVQPDPGEKPPNAWLHDGCLIVEWPAAALRQWADSPQVSLETIQPNGGVGLQISIEKDFTCLIPREGAEDADTFPNPQSATPTPHL